MKKSTKDCTFFISFFSLLSIIGISNAADTINTTHIIRNGDTIASANFELGFFNPGNSTNLYVGILYKNIPVRTPIWVANRASPLRNTTSGVLKLTQSGKLVLQDASNNTLWSSNTSRIAQNPIAQLLDTGNLVIREANDDRPENYLWQSYEYLTDTYFQGIDLGWNLITGMERFLSSWTNSEDPAPGAFTVHVDIAGYPQLVMKQGNVWRCRRGPWNGMLFSGSPYVKQNFAAHLYMNSSMVYYREDDFNTSIRFTMSQSGFGQHWIWVASDQEWVNTYNWPTDMCDSYGLCGAYGSCDIGNSPACGCLDRFVPKDEQGWNSLNRSGGCVRRTNLSSNCREDVFLKYSGIKMPDSRLTWYNESLSLEECGNLCLRNCSCTAYSNLDIRNGGSGCLIWFGNLVDIRVLAGEEQEIYIRMAASELDSRSKKREKELIAGLTSVGVILLGIGFVLYFCRRKKKGGWHKESHNQDLNLPSFELSTISRATNNFSLDNKLGEGGFGPVYKGTLEDGREIAVKRLSKTSIQGLDEFKNEVIFIAKLQHRNLVKLLGCCIRVEEKMLIYEYMPNKSLDLILFDETKCNALDWPKRVQIINGIARGLLYLHQDSRLRIVHRDLKVSNILLDIDMNPKISDFGMARTFGGNDSEANTNKIVGTYGYMPPEYAIDGLFSIKSDVFSFGVIVLEILSGKRNRRFSHKDHHHNLLGHAWILHKEGRSLELVKDNNLGENSCYLSEIIRTIQVGLLCVQKYPEDRPNMSSVIFMLENDVKLPEPKQPGFFTERNAFANDTSISTIASSANEITITMREGR